MSITGSGELINVNDADLKIATSGYAFTLSNGSKIKDNTGSAGGIQLDSNTYVNGKLEVTSNVGINTTNPDTLLHINHNNSTGKDGLRFVATDNNNWTIGAKNESGSATTLFFYYNNLTRAYFKSYESDSGNRWKILNFTGQHRCFVNNVNTQNILEYIGKIVCANNNQYYDMDMNSNVNINESLPLVSLSSTTNDKSCFGVISGGEDVEYRTYETGALVSIVEKESGDNRIFINSVGEGAIWVSNLNGNLESGDYITTSNIAGYGQKQDSEFLANYTVAKITMDCDFSPQIVPKRIIQKDADGNNVLDSNGNLVLIDSDEMISEYEVKTLDDGTKVAFVGCTYHCG